MGQGEFTPPGIVALSLCGEPTLGTYELIWPCFWLPWRPILGGQTSHWNESSSGWFYFGYYEIRFRSMAIGGKSICGHEIGPTYYVTTVQVRRHSICVPPSIPVSMATRPRAGTRPSICSAWRRLSGCTGNRIQTCRWSSTRTGGSKVGMVDNTDDTANTVWSAFYGQV